MACVGQGMMGLSHGSSRSKVVSGGSTIKKCSAEQGREWAGAIDRALGCSPTPKAGQALRRPGDVRHDNSGQHIAEQRKAEGVLVRFPFACANHESRTGLTMPDLSDGGCDCRTGNPGVSIPEQVHHARCGRYRRPKEPPMAGTSPRKRTRLRISSARQ